jgi:hypothetical protein
VRVLLSGVKNGAGYDDTNGIHGSDAVSCLCFGLSRHKTSVKRKSATDNRFVLGPASTERITTKATGGETSWRIFAKPALWQGMNVIVQLTPISLLTVFAIRNRLADPLVWPASFVALA